MYPIHKYNLCRLCLFVGDQLMNIFEENEGIDFTAEEAIEDLLQFKVVKEAGYPWLVCTSCLGKLTDFRLFKRRCIECKITFEERYKNVEEVDTVEIRPEEMQIKEETVEECSSERGEDERESGEESHGDERRDGDDEYIIDHHIRSDHETSDDFVKMETRDEGGRELGSHKYISAGDMIEVKVEEVHFKDDPCAVTRVVADAVTHSAGEVEVSPPHRNRLTVCDGLVDFASSENAAGIDGGREEFMCAICEEIFLNLESLRNHLPCRSTTMPVARGENASEKVLSDFGDRTVDWGCEGEVVVVENYLPSHGRKGKAPSDVPGGLADNVSRNVSDRRAKRVVRPRNKRSAIRVDGKTRPGGVSENVVLDKTVSYQCDMCHHGFSRLDMLKKHIQSHSEEGGYACPTCGKSFRTRWSLKNHRKSHQRVTQYECPICSRKFSRPQHLEVHRATHGTGTEYQCNICRKTFPQSSYLQMHLRAHEEDETTQCHICGKRFSQKSVLTVHLRVHMGMKPYECQICHKRFLQKNNLKNHVLSHQDVKPYSTDLGHAEKDQFNQHIRNHPGSRQFHCHLCGKRYGQEKSLKIHLENHQNSDEFAPNLDLPSHSGVSVARSAAPLLPRENYSDPTMSQFPVTMTEITANPVSDENMIAGRGHADQTEVDAPNAAPVSGVESGAEPVAREAVVPTGIRVASLGLPSCAEDTVPVVGMDLGGESAESPEVGPREGGGVVDHLESLAKVRPYKCQICHKCFGQKSDLNSHHKVHSRARPHTCTICGKRFIEGLNLRKHMIIHMDSKPFECPFCAKSFTLRKNFKRHLELDSCLKRLDLNTSECISAGEGGSQSSSVEQVSAWRTPTDSAPMNPSDNRVEQTFSGEASDNNPGGSSLNKTLDDIMAAAKEASVEVYLEQEGSVSRVFPCTFCEKTFLRTDQLKKHLMVHGGIKPHACTLCSRRFTEKGNLSKHMKTHAYEKPYPCAFCEKGYTQKKNLERHMLSHKSDQAAG